MRHQRILLLGGSGFLGGHIATRLASCARAVVIPSRRPTKARRLLLLPTVEVVKADILDDQVLGRLVRDCDAVINCVGVLHDRPAQPYGAAMRSLHVELPRRLAAACASAGVSRLIHVSALGVDGAGTGTPASMYLRSKTDGEKALSGTAGLQTTIFRPSVVFGPDDRLTNLFARLQRWLPVIVLARAGAKLQPVYVLDVADAIERALDRPETVGASLDLAGPQVMSLRELVQLSGRAHAAQRPVFGLSDGIGRVQAAVFEFAPGPTLMSRDNFDSLGVPNLHRPGSPDGFALLGIAPKSADAMLPLWLSRAPDVLDDARRRAHQ